MASSDLATRLSHFPVMEIFGPTLQGEGLQAGLKTTFVRFGYCDSRCSWCDSPQAVQPDEVSAYGVQMTAAEIRDRLHHLGICTWVTLSGGNPAMHPLGTLIESLQKVGYKISVETQGTLYPQWFKRCEALTLSPKPPSAGPAHQQVDLALLGRITSLSYPQITLKVPIFDDEDYLWATQVLRVAFPYTPLYLSVGTDNAWTGVGGAPLGVLCTSVLGRYRWLANKVAADQSLTEVYVLPQLHVLLWGDKLGV